MRYAVQPGLTENNLVLYLEGVTAPPVKNHHPTLSLEPLPGLLERIGDYQLGRQLTRLAMVLTLHLFIRSSELRFARWSEIGYGLRSPAFHQNTGYRYHGQCTESEVQN